MNLASVCRSAKVRLAFAAWAVATVVVGVIAVVTDHGSTPRGYFVGGFLSALVLLSLSVSALLRERRARRS